MNDLGFDHANEGPPNQSRDIWVNRIFSTNHVGT